MKSSTKFFMAAGATMLAGVAMAQADFTETTFGNLPKIHRTSPVIADFTNNGWLDIFQAGQLDPDLDKPGIWGWTQTSSFVFNNGLDDFSVSKWTAVPNDEPNKDEDGNPILDENGNPVYNYHIVDAPHGMRMSANNNSLAFDYNNDGFVDLILFGWDNSDDWSGWGSEWQTNHMSLYRNNGDGTFTLVEEAGFPNFRPDNDGRGYSIAAGDYDRDGYVDVLVSATDVPRGEGEELLPGRAVNLYRNVNGTGAFEKMLIANVRGGVWTNEVKDEETGAIITPKEQLEGWFLPVSGNIHFADINNDGWLDIINDGWADQCHIGDPAHPNAGNYARVYLNRNGERFDDVTPEDAAFYALRSSASNIADLDGDGYLDYFMTGWGDNGFGWEAFTYLNEAGFGADENAIFGTPLQAADQGLDGTENCRQVIRDFDGDGIYDIMYTNTSDVVRIYFGSITGNYSKVDYDGLQTGGGFATAGDLNNLGLASIYHTGYGPNGCDARLYYNTTPLVGLPIPAAPENVAYTYENGVLNITWDYDTDAAIADGLAYNVYVKHGEKIYSLVPADPATGFVKVAEGKEVALRPNLTSYSIKTAEEPTEVGVQAISLRNELYSVFNKAVNTGVESIEAVANTLRVKTTANGILVAGNGETVAVYNALGQKVAAGVAGEEIALNGNGVYVVATANGSAKIVK